MVTVTRPVRRLTAASMHSRGKRRNVVIIIEPPGSVIRFRLAGERRTVALATSVAYGLACQAEAQAKRRARAEARKAKKAARDCK